MKALITAGGHATRLRPITWNRNKHLIPLANRPMLVYAIENIVRAGITDIGININLNDTEIQSTFGDGSDYHCNLTYIEQQGGARGLAHIIKNAKECGFLNNESFLMYLGDNILFADVGLLVARFQHEQLNCLLALAKVHDPERFGVAELKNGCIVGVEEKPLIPKSNLAITGIYVYDAHALTAVDNIKLSHRGEYEITDVHQYYIDHGLKIGYSEISGWWKDTGKPDDLLHANQCLLDAMDGSVTKIDVEAKIEHGTSIEGRVSIGKNSVVSGTTVIRGPVIIGNGCVIHNSYIGPYSSIGNNVNLMNTEIEHSIVFDSANISVPNRVVNSIIGRAVQVTSAQTSKPCGHRLIVGDGSVVEI